MLQWLAKKEMAEAIELQEKAALELAKALEMKEEAERQRIQNEIDAENNKADAADLDEREKVLDEKESRLALKESILNAMDNRLTDKDSRLILKEANLTERADKIVTKENTLVENEIAFRKTRKEYFDNYNNHVAKQRKYVAKLREREKACGIRENHKKSDRLNEAATLKSNIQTHDSSRYNDAIKGRY